MTPTLKARTISAVKRFAHSAPAVAVAGLVGRNAKSIAAFATPFLLRFIAQRAGVDVPLPIAQQAVATAIVAATVWIAKNQPKPGVQP